MEMMEEDEPLSSSEAPPAPALDTEEGLSTPVAGPETPFRPTSGMPGLTPTGEHVTSLPCLVTVVTFMCEITNLFYPSTEAKESTVAHSFSALFL
jgi:hypothetical protein